MKYKPGLTVATSKHSYIPPSQVENVEGMVSDYNARCFPSCEVNYLKMCTQLHHVSTFNTSVTFRPLDLLCSARSPYFSHQAGNPTSLSPSSLEPPSMLISLKSFSSFTSSLRRPSRSMWKQERQRQHRLWTISIHTKLAGKRLESLRRDVEIDEEWFRRNIKHIIAGCRTEWKYRTVDDMGASFRKRGWGQRARRCHNIPQIIDISCAVDH